jgi:hypothetical protein
MTPAHLIAMAAAVSIIFSAAVGSGRASAADTSPPPGVAAQAQVEYILFSNVCIAGVRPDGNTYVRNGVDAMVRHNAARGGWDQVRVPGENPVALDSQEPLRILPMPCFFD